eukprot:scaffold60311_cov42-Phaeocystis_antarctica.AAC.1
MTQDWRRVVEAHRPQTIQKIKQKLEELVAPGGDDAARETKLNHIATQFEAMQWRDATSRRDYTERITKELKKLEASAAVATAVATAAATAAARVAAARVGRAPAISKKRRPLPQPRQRQSPQPQLQPQLQPQPQPPQPPGVSNAVVWMDSDSEEELDHTAAPTVAASPATAVSAMEVEDPASALEPSAA